MIGGESTDKTTTGDNCQWEVHSNDTVGLDVPFHHQAIDHKYTGIILEKLGYN